MPVDGPVGGGAFDLDRAWTLSASVALRPERFGALAYDFRTRRLSMLKDPGLAEVVRRLAEFPSAREACAAVGVDDGRLSSFSRALDTLRRSGMVHERALP